MQNTLNLEYYHILSMPVLGQYNFIQVPFCLTVCMILLSWISTEPLGICILKDEWASLKTVYYGIFAGVNVILIIKTHINGIFVTESVPLIIYQYKYSLRNYKIFSKHQKKCTETVWFSSFFHREKEGKFSSGKDKIEH